VSPSAPREAPRRRGNAARKPGRCTRERRSATFPDGRLCQRHNYLVQSLAPLQGFFADSVPSKMRTDGGGDPAARVAGSLSLRIGQRTKTVALHADYPEEFERLLERVDGIRGPAGWLRAILRLALTSTGPSREAARRRSMGDQFAVVGSIF
jgi:hypothetical protein